VHILLLQPTIQSHYHYREINLFLDNKQENLEHIGKDDKWLWEELAKYNVSDINDIFLVEYDGDDKLFIVRK